jgi:hypothetical protein
MEFEMKTETVTISKFKAACLGLLKQVKKKGEPILWTPTSCSDIPGLRNK